MDVDGDWGEGTPPPGLRMMTVMCNSHLEGSWHCPEVLPPPMGSGLLCSSSPQRLSSLESLLPVHFRVWGVSGRLKDGDVCQQSVPLQNLVIRTCSFSSSALDILHGLCHLVPCHFCSSHSPELLGSPPAVLPVAVTCCCCDPAAAFVAAVVPPSSSSSQPVRRILSSKVS